MPHRLLRLLLPHLHGATATIYIVASYTAYSDDAGQDSIRYQYDYTWKADSFQYEKITTTSPAVDSSQNGSGVAAETRLWYDANGNLAWQEDARGTFTYNYYDPTTGRLMCSFQDIDGGTFSDFETEVNATLWIPTDVAATLDSSGHINARTDYAYDARGRVVQVLGPMHDAVVEGLSGPESVSVRTAAWTFYDDAGHETFSAQGYVLAASPSTATILGPISITKTDLDGRVTDQIQAVWSGTVAELLTAMAANPATAFARSSYVSWTANTYRNTRLAFTATYFQIPSDGDTTRDTNGFYGVEGADYTKTTIGYENAGHNQTGDTWKIRQNKVQAADGTITRSVLDARGNVVETWIGTDDYYASDSDPSGGTVGQTGGNNMVKVAEYAYNADGNVTSATQYVGGGSPDRVTEYGYDWRDRLEYVISPADDQDRVTYVMYHYDNLGRAVETESYWDDTNVGTLEPWTNDTTPGQDQIFARSKTFYDDLGRVYRTATYSVDPTDATATAVGNTPLVSNVWYDAAGNVIKQQAAGTNAFTKTLYDGLGRPTVQYVGYDLDEEDYDEADDVAGDTIFQQTVYDYNEASQTIFVTSYERNHDATNEGVLTTSTARVSYAASWYDGIGRQVAAANYGTELPVGGRPDTPPSVTSTDALVSKTEYVFADVVGDSHLEYIVKSKMPTSSETDARTGLFTTPPDEWSRPYKTLWMPTKTACPTRPPRNTQIAT